MADRWTMQGTVLIACNCDYGCPCNFNALPTTGKCEGQWTWHIEEGTYDGTDLGGLTFTLAVNWPGAIHEGNGEGLLLVDERSDESQRDAIHLLVKGEAGGPWGVLGWTLADTSRAGGGSVPSSSSTASTHACERARASSSRWSPFGTPSAAQR